MRREIHTRPGSARDGSFFSASGGFDYDDFLTFLMIPHLHFGLWFIHSLRGGVWAVAICLWTFIL